MKLYIALILGLIVLTVRGDNKQDDSRESNGYSLKFIGKAPKFLFAPSLDNSSWVRVEFGSVYEQTKSGQKLPVHTIGNLAAAKPVYTTGFETINSTNVTFVLMTLPFANMSTLAYNGSNCASPVVSAADFADGYLAIKVYIGFSSDVIFPYGVNNTVVAPANSTKFSIDAKAWPFCSTTNTLQIELKISTGAGNATKPIHSEHTEDEEEDMAETVSANATAVSTTSSAPPSSRKIFSEGGDNNNNDNDNGNANGNANDHANTHANAGVGAAGGGQGKPPGRPPTPAHPQDPRVVGKPRKQVALLTGKPGRAAVMDFEAFAYDAINGTRLYNVTTAVLQHGPHLTVTLGFPYFTSIYYDPTLVTDVDSAVVGYSAGTTAEATAAATATPKNAGCSLKLGAMSVAAGGVLLALLL